MTKPKRPKRSRRKRAEPEIYELDSDLNPLGPPRDDTGELSDKDRQNYYYDPKGDAAILRDFEQFHGTLPGSFHFGQMSPPSSGDNRTSPYAGAMARWGRPRGEMPDGDAAEWLAWLNYVCTRIENVPDLNTVAAMFLYGRVGGPLSLVQQVHRQDMYKIVGMLSTVHRRVTGPESFLTAIDECEERFHAARRRWADVERDARKLAAKLAYPVIKRWLGVIDLPLREAVQELPAGVIDRRRRPKDIRGLSEEERIALAPYAMWATEVLGRQAIAITRDKGGLG